MPRWFNALHVMKTVLSKLVNLALKTMCQIKLMRLEGSIPASGVCFFVKVANITKINDNVFCTRLAVG